MTDTSTEAVEVMARMLERAGYFDAPKLLRALAAERDALALQNKALQELHNAKLLTGLSDDEFIRSLAQKGQP